MKWTNKILSILLYNNLVWQLLDVYETKFSDRVEYLREILLSVINCGKSKSGYLEYKCENCGEEYRICFSCNKRFCNRCGYRRTEEWSEKSASKVLNVGHRHISFTIPEVLRAIFAYERKLLKILPRCGKQVLEIWGCEKGIEKQGMISVIHTFGYDLKWNPHVHFIVSEGGLTKSNRWQDWPWKKWLYDQPYISYSCLRKHWRRLISKSLGKELAKLWDKNQELQTYIYTQVKNFKKQEMLKEKEKPQKKRKKISLRNKPSKRDIKDLLDSVEQQEWYVNAESRLTDGKSTIRYIGRYSNRPAMSECRIISFNGSEVKFWYEQKKKFGKTVKKIRKVTALPVKEFIKRMLRHIPEKGFRMIEWYGLYANNVWNKVKETLCNLGKYVTKAFKRMSYRDRMIKSFGKDPLKCKKCGSELLLYTINYYKAGKLRIKRYLGKNGYIGGLTKREYDYDNQKFPEVCQC